MASLGSMELSSYFYCFGMKLLSEVCVCEIDGRRTLWTLRWSSCERKFKNLKEVSAFASQILLVPWLNEEVYLIVKAYFDGDLEERMVILNWIKSEGRIFDGVDIWGKYVEKRRTRLSVRRLPGLIEATPSNRKRFGLLTTDDPLFELGCDEIKNPWYGNVLKIIRNEELKRLRATLPVASVASRPASRL